MNKRKHDIDKIIKDAIQEEFDSIEPLFSSNEAWEKFQYTNKKKSFPIFSSKKIMYPIYSFLLLLILLIVTPNNSSAFSKVVNFFNTVQGNVANLFISNDIEDKAESSLVDFSIEKTDIRPVSMSLDDAKKEISFILLEPKWIPDHFYLEDIIVFKESNLPSNEVHFIYVNKEQKEFIIRQLETGDTYGVGKTLDTDDSLINELNINGNKATLINHKSDYVELVWIAQDIHISIEGELSEEEAIQIAESMYR